MCRLATALLAMILCASARAQTGSPLPGAGAPFDCVIEPHLMVELGSPVEGVLEAVLVEPGDRVHEGQELARLDSRVERAELAVARARAEMDAEIEARRATAKLSERSRERAEDLFSREVISVQLRDQSEAESTLASAQLKQAEEQQRVAQLEVWRATEALARRTIRSPIDGVVTKRSRVAGERVDEQEILTLAQLHPLNIELIIGGELFGGFIR